MKRLKVLLTNLFAVPYRIFFTNISVLTILQDSHVNKRAAICSGTKFYRSSMDKYSYIGRNCFVNNTSIGKFTSIAGNCYIGSPSHPTDWVSTSPAFHKWDNVLHKNFERHEYPAYMNTKIGSDVWIGEGCKIKAGITIGDGAIVGMGSVVTKDVEPYTVCAGNPARIIRKRFDEEIITSLLSLEWWNWSEEQIKFYAKYFDKPAEMIKVVKENNIIANER